jgi:hypothetical protein
LIIQQIGTDGPVLHNDACFIVRDHNGQQLAYVYFEDEPGRRSVAKLLSKDEARRIAANIAKLPGQRQDGGRACLLLLETHGQQILGECGTPLCRIAF